jgi:hypothetical protein
MQPYVGLFLANHDWRFQMDVKDHKKLVVTRLEEQVLDITEQYILGSVSVSCVYLQRDGSPIFCVPKGEWYRSPF